MLGLERFLQSNDYPASEIILTATYLLIRPASFTCWLLLACPFPLLSIFLHFPIDFLFADFAGCSADNLDPKTFPHELAVHVGIMPAEPIVLRWRENSLVVQNGADAP